MLSLVTYLAVFILKIIESTRDIGNALNNLFLIFPQECFHDDTGLDSLAIFESAYKFCFAMGLFDIYNNANLAESCEKTAISREACASDDFFSYTLHPWSFESGGIGRYLVALSLHIPAFFLMLALIEWELATKLGFQIAISTLIETLYRAEKRSTGRKPV